MATKTKEETETTVNASQEANTTGPAAPAPAAVSLRDRFKVTKNVTVALLKQAEGEEIAVRVVSNIYRGRELKRTASGPAKKPAFLCHVVDLMTGELCNYITAALVKSELEENYPPAKGAAKDAAPPYVGKSFIILRGPKKKGGANEYNTYKVTEIELDPSDPAQKAAGAVPVEHMPDQWHEPAEEKAAS